MKRNAIWWSVAMENAICVMCFTALAIIFNKWWIVLFSILHATSVKVKEQEGEDNDRQN